MPFPLKFGSRPSRVSSALRARGTSLDNLQFVRDDALNVTKCGMFEIVYCCGLLYHLDQPRDYPNTLTRICKKLLMNTHFATTEEYTQFNLLPHEGLRGRWFHEYDEKNDGARIDQLRWAVYSYSRSFWVMRGDLVLALHQAGFATVVQ